MSYDDSPPTVKQELERKTVELLETLVHRAETHRLPQRDLAMIGKALWGITSGLVDDGVSELCARVADAGKAKRMTRNFVGKGKVIQVAWMADNNGYAVVTRDADAPHEMQVRPVKTEVGLREEELKTLFAALAKSGYSELI